MALDPGEALYVQTFVLEDEGAPWDESRTGAVLRRLGAAGFVPSGGVDACALVSASERSEPVPFSGPCGAHHLELEPDGSWRWDTPSETLMKDRHNNRPEAVDTLVDAAQALLEAATPYFAVSWLDTQAPPYWARTDLPFKAHEGGAVTFFSKRYLDEHRGGRPFEDPPVSANLPVAKGQLLIAGRRAFGEASVSALSDLHEYLQRTQFS